MSVFSSNLNVLQAWNSCSGVLPIFEYCHLNLFCKAGQSSSKRANDSYHNLASPVSVKWKCLTLTSFGKLCASIQSLILRTCDSTSSSGLPENSRLLSYPILVKYLRGRHYWTNRNWLYRGWLEQVLLDQLDLVGWDLWWWRLHRHILTNLSRTLNLVLDCRAWAWFWTAGHWAWFAGPCTTSTNWSWALGLAGLGAFWSIHHFSNLLPNQSISEYLSSLDFALFPSIYI